MYCRSRSSYQKRRIGIPITGLKPGPNFQCHMLSSFLCSVSSFKMVVIFRFVDIDRIDDHHCLNYLFIMNVLKICS